MAVIMLAQIFSGSYLLASIIADSGNSCILQTTP